MADQGKLIGTAQILPDELVTIISNTTYSYTPGSGDKWYYKLTDVTTSDEDLIKSGGPFLQGQGTSAGRDTSEAFLTIDGANDKIKWLFIKHTGFRDDGTTANNDSVYISLDASTSNPISTNDADCIEIGSGESLALKLNVITNSVHAEVATAAFAGDSASNSVQCIVAAIINDAS
tara:strand:+ start:4241 stop:4768 length:528 start_codon:yes stop_codon:yes gene_type:complete